MKCSRCSEKTKKARPVSGYIICNSCNIILIRRGQVYLSNGAKMYIN